MVAALLYQAIGPQLSCILVDNGLLRQAEEEAVISEFTRHFKTDLHVVKAEDQFLAALAGVTDPQEKRRRIGHTFIDCFAAEAKKIEGARFLAQGTLYPDVIESGAAPDGPADTIKLHHNVGGLPAELGFELIEPLRDLFKDEVRRLGLQLGLPEDMVWRHPFPGPGLAVRCLGEVTRERLDDAADGRRDRRERDQSGRAVPGDVAGVRRAAAGAERGRDGRRPHVRQRARRAVREHRRLHDGRLEPPAVRAAGAHLDADHQRGEGRQPRGLRHQLQAAGDDRMGVTSRKGAKSQRRQRPESRALRLCVRQSLTLAPNRTTDVAEIHLPDRRPDQEVGQREVLKDIWLAFYPGAKIGVLGRNGSGKSTLLRIMAGKDKDFDGEAKLTEGFTVGLLEQEPQLNPEKDVLGNVEEAVAATRAMLDEFEAIARSMPTWPTTPTRWKSC